MEARSEALTLKVAQAAGAIHAAEELKEARYVHTSTFTFA